MIQWPEISRFDPVAQAIGLRPKEVCKIIRSSETAITSTYYRMCLILILFLIILTINICHRIKIVQKSSIDPK